MWSKTDSSGDPLLISSTIGDRVGVDWGSSATQSYLSETPIKCDLCHQKNDGCPENFEKIQSSILFHIEGEKLSHLKDRQSYGVPKIFVFNPNFYSMNI